MNSELLLDAIGEARDEHIVSAVTRLGYITTNTSKPLSRKSRTPKRKALIGLAAAIILLLGSFVTAMAVSEDFREAVFAFFHISVLEVVPETRPETQSESPEYSVSEVELDEMIHAKYIWIPGWSTSQNGIFLCSKDEIVYNRGSRFELYAEEGNELIPVETRAVNMDYNWNGRDYHFEFEWGAHGNHLAFAYVYDRGDNGWYFMTIPDSASSVMVSFDHITKYNDDEYPIYSQYPMVFDLENERIIDPLEGCGVESLTRISNAVFSDDLSRALLAQNSDDYLSHMLYYCDTGAKQFYSIDELSGQRTDACVFTGDNLTCWALGDDGNYDCWRINLTTYERTEVFEDIPAYNKAAGHGIVFIDGFDIMHHAGWACPGSSYALEVKEDASVYVIDLDNGEQFLIEGFLWPDSVNTDMECVGNPTGTRLLICERGEGSFGYNRVGVIDFAAKCYIRLERGDFTINEQSIYWFDADRIVVATDSDEIGGSVYIYKFNSP